MMNLMVCLFNVSADTGWTGCCPFSEDRNYSRRPVVRFSFDQQRTRRERRGCNHGVPRAGSLSLGR
jgi:hypothetical protein